MSDTGKLTLRSVEETVRGATPSAALDTCALVSSWTPTLTRGTEVSNAMRGDYRKPFVYEQQQDGGGTANYEYSYGDVPLMQWAEGVFRNDWTAATTVTGADITITAATKTIASPATDLSVLVPFRWYRITGGTNAGKLVRIATSATTTATYDLVLGPFSTSAVALVDQATGTSLTLTNSSRLTEGTALKWFSIEEHQAELAEPFGVSTMQVPSQWSLDVQKKLVTGSMQFMGSPQSAQSATSAGSGSFNPKSTNRGFTGSGYISTILEGGVALAARAPQIQVQYGSPVRLKHALGPPGPWDVGGNSFAFTGSVNLYLNDAGVAVWEKYRTFAATSLYFYLIDPAGNIAVHSFPAIRYVGATRDATGPDADRYANLNFTAELDAVSDSQVAVDLIAA